MTVTDLFERRLLVVVGKGGVGKSTVACALAIEAARRGLRALVCEVDGVGRAAHLLRTKPGPVGQAVEARPGVSVMGIEGQASLEEYLGLIIPARVLLRSVFSSRLYQYFVAAAPGLKELMMIGKIWYEADRVDESTGRRLWDVVVMDAPATGHSLQYLRMPAAARDAFGAGLVNREAQRIVDRLADPAHTAVNLVTTAEEMPVNETLTMYKQLREELGMPTGYLFVNRLHRAGFQDTDIERVRAAAARMRDGRERAALLQVAARAAEEAGWTRLNERYRTRLARSIAMPVVEIPYLFAAAFGPVEVEAVSACLAEASAEAPGRRGRA